MTFTVEPATADVNAACMPYFVSEMAAELGSAQVDLSGDQPLIILVGLGFSARVVAPCLDLAVLVAKEKRHGATQPPQLLS